MEVNRGENNFKMTCIFFHNESDTPGLYPKLLRGPDPDFLTLGNEDCSSQPSVFR